MNDIDKNDSISKVYQEILRGVALLEIMGTSINENICQHDKNLLSESCKEQTIKMLIATSNLVAEFPNITFSKVFNDNICLKNKDEVSIS